MKLIAAHEIMALNVETKETVYILQFQLLMHFRGMFYSVPNCTDHIGGTVQRVHFLKHRKTTKAEHAIWSKQVLPFSNYAICFEFHVIYELCVPLITYVLLAHVHSY